MKIASHLGELLRVQFFCEVFGKEREREGSRMPGRLVSLK